MRLGFLPCTPAFMRENGLLFMPPAWRLVGTDRSSTSAPMWLVFENDDDGPNVEIDLLIEQTAMSVTATVRVTGERHGER